MTYPESIHPGGVLTSVQLRHVLKSERMETPLYLRVMVVPLVDPAPSLKMSIEQAIAAVARGGGPFTFMIMHSTPQ
jgi:hypothetical protein